MLSLSLYLLSLLTLAGCSPTTPSLGMESRTLFFSQKTRIEPFRCISYAVNANYRRAEVLLNGQQIDHVLVSDVALSECS